MVKPVLGASRITCAMYLRIFPLKSLYLQRYNYIPQGVIQLPEKTALLYSCNNNDYHNYSWYFLNKNLETPNDENTDC